MNLKKFSFADFLVADVLVLAAIALSPFAAFAEEIEAQKTQPGALALNAKIINQKGQQIGTATFNQEGPGVDMTVKVQGLEPGEHGIHIHERGECDPRQQFKTAGGHLNPDKKSHGFEDPKGPHKGDLRNIKVDKNGTGQMQVKIEDVVLAGNMETSLVRKQGTALVIHAQPDDYKTDPSGSSGDRVACAVISPNRK